MCLILIFNVDLSKIKLYNMWSLFANFIFKNIGDGNWIMLPDIICYQFSNLTGGRCSYAESIILVHIRDHEHMHFCLPSLQLHFLRGSQFDPLCCSTVQAYCTSLHRIYSPAYCHLKHFRWKPMIAIDSIFLNVCKSWK